MVNKFDYFINLVFHTKWKYVFWSFVAFLIIIFAFFISKINNDSNIINTDETYAVSTQSSSSINASVESSSSSTTVKNDCIYIDIKGEVKNPGVYKINIDKRVNDAIVLAGGFTKAANDKNVNLAQKLTDQMVILVENKNVKNSEGNDVLNDVNTSNQSKSNDSSERINVNTADANKLMSISGIGQKKAEKIIDYRNKNGLFNSLDDLKNVDGFGDKTVERLKEYLFT
ncbi:ComEA family DNA-binding protein [Apilactobacillus sp. TMW 2.2459]|uniref:ComEA family DNA-binding protein n=1 Tax=Apilactobacillus xinyiensis TaxID=2841032 RepID=UPI00200F8D2E|nr:ComEA family DNA-binding protein [Apilactobacillus xinyiensis]MCL0312385.1 ComEA family DNA-binding protein [Apilactobacillus xinyiensis]